MMHGLVVRIIGFVAILLCLSVGAEAHRLKLFATVEGGVVHGYGFFIGGGRPSEAQLVIRDASGTELFRGPTGADGSFSFTPAVASDLDLSIDAGDGHAAETRISANRFPPNGTFSPIGPASAAGGADTPKTIPDKEPSPRLDASGQDLAMLVDRSVDRAVSRQITPLLEAYAEADGRARFNDVISGIAVIIGMAGLLLWGRARRRTDKPPPTGSP